MLDMLPKQVRKKTKTSKTLAGIWSYRGKSQWNFDQWKGNLVLVSGEFELSELELSRFYRNL